MVAVALENPVKNHLRQLPLFGPLKDDALADIAAYGLIRHEKKGTLLFAPESTNDKFYIVIKGWIKLFRETLSGEEAVIDILTVGHSFGEIGLSGTEPIPYGAAIIEDAEILSLPRFLLAEEIMRNSLFGLSVLKGMTQRKMQSDLEIEHRTVQTAPQRIGCFLLKFCRTPESNHITLHLPYDKTIIAGRLGMQPETFSRALAKLREETGIKVKGSTVEIDDIKKLVAYTCAACSSSFPCKE